MIAWVLTAAALAQTSDAQAGTESPRGPAAPAGEQRGPDFTDRDGNPLPADVQEELRRQLRDRLPARQPALPEPVSDQARGDTDITVSGQRPRGSIAGTVPPERTFSPLEIGALGASNIRELIDSLGAQVTGDRDDGAPVTLLNGRRVSSFNEIAEIPTEAIERTEIFPEEVAIQYGYRPGQKVVNIVTYERFSSRVGQVSAAALTEGDYASLSVAPNYFAIRSDRRFDVSADYTRSSNLLESDRGVVQPGGIPDAGRSRTLVPQTERLALNGLISGPLVDEVSSTLNLRYQRSDLRDLLGQVDGQVIRRDSVTDTASVGTTLHGAVAKWLWTFNGSWDRTTSDIRTDTVVPGSRDLARSTTSVARADFVLSGTLGKLPAGPVSATIRSTAAWRDVEAVSQTTAFVSRAELARQSGAVQASVNVPIASRRSGARFGDLSLNGNLAVERLSDFGGLLGYGFGFSWTPIQALNIYGSLERAESAPTVEQLGNPLLITPNARILDFGRGEVVDITRLSGGNSLLASDQRRTTRLAVVARPISGTDLTVTVEYSGSRTDRPIVQFPIVTPELEAAFPDRFSRAEDGRLVQLDQRPLNLARASQQRLRWGLSFVRPLGPVEPWMKTAPVRTYTDEAAARAAAPPGAIVSMVQPGSAMARKFDNLSSRFYLNLFHTWQLRDRVSLSERTATLDLLDGGALDFFGGTRRHRLELQAGLYKSGLGGRLSANWRSGSRVRDPGQAGELRFADLATVNLNLFANLGDAIRGADKPAWLKGTRVTLALTNLFNQRQRVRDASGNTPLSYQQPYLDPLGRSVSLTLRKMF